MKIFLGYLILFLIFESFAAFFAYAIKKSEVFYTFNKFWKYLLMTNICVILGIFLFLGVIALTIYAMYLIKGPLW